MKSDEIYRQKPIDKRLIKKKYHHFSVNYTFSSILSLKPIKISYPSNIQQISYNLSKNLNHYPTTNSAPKLD
jgi:hypothetical protein